MFENVESIAYRTFLPNLALFSSGETVTILWDLHGLKEIRGEFNNDLTAHPSLCTTKIYMAGLFLD